MGTESSSYADYLARAEGRRWKRMFQLVDPYRWHIRKLVGDQRVLDIGCGAGRNLRFLDRLDAVGIDHNEFVVELCRKAGFNAFTTDEFRANKNFGHGSFGVLLMSHLLEHLSFEGATRLVLSYLPYLSESGTTIMICPQEKGQAHDDTHVTFFDRPKLAELCRSVGLEPTVQRSFPLPPRAGRWLYFNENVVVAHRRRGDP
ncbi:MAG: class I SAM-dependent methyltransferase [Actinobacteria bacterium]|nr:class I SAM-dependent methyltransferase [Actinomycetota bacterium]